MNPREFPVTSRPSEMNSIDKKLVPERPYTKKKRKVINKQLYVFICE